MAIDFPDNPATDQVFTAGQRSWSWNGRAWQAKTTNVGYTGSAGAYSAIGYTGSAGTSTIPFITKSSSYTLQASDNGVLISITTGGITVPSGIFTAGMNISIFNNSSSNQTIIQGTSTTIYLAGATTPSTGNRTIGPYGLAAIICVRTDTFTISGPGIS
jgi:hypothetical protein